MRLQGGLYSLLYIVANSIPFHIMSSKKKQRIFAFDRMNFILLAVGMAVVILGMILMSGSGSGRVQR